MICDHRMNNRTIPILYRTMRAATNMRPAMRPVDILVMSPAIAALLVVALAAATEEVEEADDSVAVAVARVVEAAVVEVEEVVDSSLAFLLPHLLAASLQARWPVASLACEVTHWP
jgi:hypothetical protein